MSKIDRAVIKGIFNGEVVFDPKFRRTADFDQLHFCRNFATNHWSIVINSGNQIKLSFLAHTAMVIAEIYSRNRTK